MLIAQISDMHLSAPGQLTYGHVDAAVALKRVIAHLNASDRLPDMAIISGDLTNNGSETEMHHARALLDGLACPYRVIPGNHDSRAVLARVFGPEHCPVPEGDFVNFVHETGPFHLVVLDTVDEGSAGGAFCERRAAWLGSRLAERADTPAMIFLHHPPLPLGVPETDADGFRGAEELGQIIAAHGKVLRICAGHIHLATQTMWQGVPVCTAPSTGMELTRDFAETGDASRFSKSTPGYLMHHLTNGGQLVTHVIEVPGEGTTYPFSIKG